MHGGGVPLSPPPSASAAITMPTLPPALALLPLRLFLGATFVYAGLQKLSDPGFLQPGSTTYIGTQLHAFAAGTPGGFLLRWFAEPIPTIAGVGVAATEIMIGLLVLAGLATRAAAAAGLGLNLLLFLTATWNTSPYFLGSDIVFVFAWLPLALAGAEGQPSLDAVIARRAAVTARPLPRRRAAAMRVHGAGMDGPELTRSQMLTRGVGAAAGITALLAAAATVARGGLARPERALSAPRRRHHAAHRRAASSGPTPASQPQVPAGAVKIAPSSSLHPGQAISYSDPADGSPDVVMRQADGSLSALSAVCTHAGCQVSYSGGQLVCPCHGSIFDAGTGAVLQGPATVPLARRRVVQAGGEIYAV
jgi:thiosulfate dehydrogenase (quinone) large subunit